VDENLPLILLAISLVIIVLIVFAIQRKKRQTQLRASMYRQWRDYPGHVGNETGESVSRQSSAELGTTVDAVNMDRILDDDAEIISEVRIVKATPAPKQQYTDLVVFYVMARAEQLFVGYELLQALSAVGLQYGEMNIFHYRQEPDDTKALFSVASASEPGTFDLSEMGGIQCKGLCAFMDTKHLDDPRTAFETMLSTVKQLAEDLGGTVQDQRRQPITEQSIMVARMRMRSSAQVSA
jgi:cell division protein ZipA